MITHVQVTSGSNETSALSQEPCGDYSRSYRCCHCRFQCCCLRAAWTLRAHGSRAGHIAKCCCKASHDTAADMTTGCAFKIEDPSRGFGRADFTAPNEGFGLEGTPKPKIQRDPSPKKRNLICGTPLYGQRRTMQEQAWRSKKANQP